MPSLCDRCHKEKWKIIKSIMNEDKICLGCLQEELKHPRFNEAKDREILEAWKGNYDYPGLFAGQKYPFGEGAAVSENFPLDKAKSPMMKDTVSP